MRVQIVVGLGPPRESDRQLVRTWVRTDKIPHTHSERQSEYQHRHDHHGWARRDTPGHMGLQPAQNRYDTDHSGDRGHGFGPHRQPPGGRRGDNKP